MSIGAQNVAPPLATDDSRWEAVVQRDRRADSHFWYSVRTTGVYCRPSCGSRLARRENVNFHATPAAAERAGFRPCKRCRPREASQDRVRARAVTQACRMLEAAETPLSLADLAAAVGMSRYHFHRIFKSITGVTPRAYAASCRAERARRELQNPANSVTGALYNVGFASNGAFYAASEKLLGMSPITYRAGGQSERITFALGDCSLGKILVAATERGVCAILLGEDTAQLEFDLERRFPQAELVRGDRDFGAMMHNVIQAVEQPHLGAGLPLDIRGTAFQQRVWQELAKIPAGSTASYGEIAARMGMPQAARAVANACGANPIAVAVPCHRAVRGDGQITGYRWGVDRKRELLRRERGI